MIYKVTFILKTDNISELEDILERNDIIYKLEEVQESEVL